MIHNTCCVITKSVEKLGTTTNCVIEVVSVCIVWAVHQAINAIEWLQNWFYYQTTRGLTNIKVSAYSVVKGVIMVSFGC